MKKFNVAIGSLLVGGMLLSGCGDSEGNTKEVQAMSEVDHSEEVVNNNSYKSLEEWAKAADKMLSEPLDDPQLVEANNDEGFEYYLKAQKVMDGFPMELMEEGNEIEKAFAVVPVLVNEIDVEQIVRTSHIEGAVENLEIAVENIDQWRPSDEMKKSFAELKKVVKNISNGDEIN